ncbi:hypothetical protein [Dolichospermum sp. UHCC 0259]|uniref:hypothetical protein n=1 Tax=Dolichospermum sp. UHCC 0259 TaxID=2590010 RepID=UPI001447D234|nr:hypothetical protein [Dolichospermum sp. UHCC 0259]MTJ47336.1 hypothetical protein [Dolichospermum sp. UHCC 0259]
MSVQECNRRSHLVIPIKKLGCSSTFAIYICYLDFRELVFRASIKLIWRSPALKNVLFFLLKLTNSVIKFADDVE